MRRYLGLDWLRGLAAFGIVGCHLNLLPHCRDVSLLLHFNDMNVGVFGAVSGFLVAASLESSRSSGLSFARFVGKKVRRLMPIYVFWSIIYVLLSWLSHSCQGGDSVRFQEADYWCSVVFFGGASCHLWYLICLMYGTIVMGALIWFVKVLWARRLALALCSIASIWAAAVGSSNLCLYPVRLFAFVCAGALMHEMGVVRRQCRPMLIGLVSAAMLASYAPIWPHHFISDYICACLIVSIALQYEGNRSARWFGELSLGVYLIHPILTASLGIVLRYLFSAPYAVGVVAFDWLVCYGLAVVLSSAAVRMPFLKKFII